MRSNLFLAAIPSVLALAASVSAQAVVVPSAAATTRPTNSPFYTANVFYSTTSVTTAPASRTQTIVDTSDIAPPAAVWNSLQVRRPVGLGNANPALVATATIVMSMSTSAASASTTTFASNHGAAPTTVFQAQLNLAAETNPPAWPAPWQAPVPFATPFVYVGIPGGSLVIDIHQDQGASPSGTPWYVEYTSPIAGGRIANGVIPSSCRFSVGGYNSGLGWTTGGLQGNGGIWYVSYQGGQMPPNQVGVGVLGVSGVGGSWGGRPLPIDLGVLGAPGCQWNISWELSVPLQSTTTGARWPNLTIPNDPGLRGASFYEQGLFIDPPANALGLVVSQSSRWQIAPLVSGGPGAFVYATGSNHQSATGTREAGGLPTLQLQ